MNTSSKIQKTIYGELFPTQLKKSDETKLKILDAAIDTYADLGINYVSYEDIARAAGITRPLIQHYFPDKKELFLTAMKYVRAQMQTVAVERIQAIEKPLEQFKEYVRSNFYSFEKKPNLMRAWMFFYYICASDPSFRAHHVKLTEIGHERILSMLKKGAAQGDFSGKELPRKAKTVQRIITGLFIELMSEYSIKEMARIREEAVEDCIKVVL